MLRDDLSLAFVAGLLTGAFLLIVTANVTTNPPASAAPPPAGEPESIEATYRRLALASLRATGGRPLPN